MSIETGKFGEFGSNWRALFKAVRQEETCDPILNLSELHGCDVCEFEGSVFSFRERTIQDPQYIGALNVRLEGNPQPGFEP